MNTRAYIIEVTYNNEIKFVRRVTGKKLAEEHVDNYNETRFGWNETYSCRPVKE